MWATNRPLLRVGFWASSRLGVSDEVAQLNDAGHAQDGRQDDAADGGDQQRVSPY
jgi:hypothetical protein